MGFEVVKGERCKLCAKAEPRLEQEKTKRLEAELELQKLKTEIHEKIILSRDKTIAALGAKSKTSLTDARRKKKMARPTYEKEDQTLKPNKGKRKRATDSAR